jgi:transcriptional regulator with XRE-family HTH domain
MEFHEKLQELRKKKGITQEELAECLFVSRTAVSKWESGRGYPNIESLKAIAKYFSVTIDELLSSDEVLTIAEEDSKKKESHFCDLIFGLLDLSTAMFFFMPLFGVRSDQGIQAISLMMLDGIYPYLKTAYLAATVILISVGILTLALQNVQLRSWAKNKTILSLSIGAILVLLLIATRQPYAAVFAFVSWAIKVSVLIKRP